MKTLKTMTVIAALALVSACGSSDEPASGTEPDQPVDVAGQCAEDQPDCIDTVDTTVADEPAADVDTTVADEPAADDAGGTPVVAGMCAQDHPDCDDMVVVDGTDEPMTDDSGGATLSGGMVVDGGLTVEEAIATDATGVLAVHGYVFEDADGARICDAIAESYPPQCGGASLALRGFTLDQFGDLPDDESGAGVQADQGLRWTDQPITLFGEVDGDSLVVSMSTA